MFSNFCEMYYPASTDFQQGPCPVFVGAFFEILARVDPVYHCDQIGACGAPDQPHQELPVSAALQDEGPICKVCEQMVEQVKQQLEDPDFVQETKERIDAFCSYLKPIGEEEVCRQMLRQNLDEAIEFIEAIEPLKYCQSMRLCSQRRLPESRTKLPTLANFYNFGIETSVELGGKVIKDVSQLDRQPPTCMICELAIRELVHFLGNNRTEAAIDKGLDEICYVAYRDPSAQRSCERLVATYSKEIIQMLSAMSDAKAICIALQQCVFKTSEVLGQEPKSVATLEDPDITMSKFISMLDPTIRAGSLRSCVECKLFVNYLKTTLDGRQSQEELKGWLIKNLCDSLGDESMKASCRSLVEKNAAEFFNAIAANLDPQATCQELGACKQRRYPLVFDFSVKQSPVTFTLEPKPSLVSVKEQTVAGPKIKKPATPFCDGCVQVVRKIDEYLSTNSIEDDVNQLITGVCDKLPLDKLKNGCTRLVEYYGKEIMEHISVMDDPLHLCTKITLC